MLTADSLNMNFTGSAPPCWLGLHCLEMLLGQLYRLTPWTELGVPNADWRKKKTGKLVKKLWRQREGNVKFKQSCRENRFKWQLLITPVWEMSGLNLDLDTVYSQGFPGFPQSLQISPCIASVIVTRTHHSTPSSIHQLLTGRCTVSVKIMLTLMDYRRIICSPRNVCPGVKCYCCSWFGVLNTTSSGWDRL
jgi:hypothetical protein